MPRAIQLLQSSLSKGDYIYPYIFPVASVATISWVLSSTDLVEIFI